MYVLHYSVHEVKYVLCTRISKNPFVLFIALLLFGSL